MNENSCNPSHVGQAGEGGANTSGATAPDGRPPTGQAGTGQSGGTPKNPAAPEDYDTDPQAGGGKLDQVRADDAPADGGDAPSHGSR